MGQRNQIEGNTAVMDRKFAADYLLQLFEGNELRDSELSDRDDKARPKDFELVVHPRGAVADFVRGRDTIATARGFPRETAEDRGEVDERTSGCFGHSEKFFKPTKQ